MKTSRHPGLCRALPASSQSTGPGTRLPRSQISRPARSSGTEDPRETVVRKPPTQGGPKYGSHYHSHSVNCHCGSPFLGRESFQHDCLGDRLQSASSGTLDNSGYNQKTQAGSQSAEQRSKRKDRDTSDQETSAAKAS